MKKLLVVLLSLGLILAFGMTASAQTSVKFSGYYYVVGAYNDNLALSGSDKAYSKAYFYNAARVQTDFKVAEGLTFTTRFDAKDKQWGNTNWSGGTDDKSNSQKAAVAGGTPLIQENLELEHAYVNFKTGMGSFVVGYQATDTWGTVFADTPGSRAKIVYTLPVSPVVLGAAYEKVFESTGSSTAAYAGRTSADNDTYALSGTYLFKGGAAGLLLKYTDYNSSRPASNFKTELYSVSPYIKGQFGPVYVEGELVYIGGKLMKYDNATYGNDVTKEGLGVYALAKVNLGPAYVGGQFGFSSGDPDNPTATTTTGAKTGPPSSTSWVPTLIWGEANLNTWSMGGVQNPNKTNMFLYNVFGGFNVTPKFNIEAAVSMMNADKTLTGVAKEYGTEADIKATYKIYDNLTYMVGAGYLWTGNYYKGASNASIGNDYIVLNRLTVNF